MVNNPQAIDARMEKELEEQFAKDAEVIENGKLNEREADPSTYGKVFIYSL
jgi:hypothetical protein